MPTKPQFDYGFENIPLYPLQAVYLPTKHHVNYTLNNVEAQNVQMAKDLLLGVAMSNDTKSSKKVDTNDEPRFCVVLRTIDTGRIASIGTIMKIVNAEEQTHYGTNRVSRIQLTCQAEGLVRICRVENGHGWSEKRLMKSNEYLRATVKQEPCDAMVKIDHETFRNKLAAISTDLRMIKTRYQLGIGGDDFIPGTLPNLGNAIGDVDLEDIGSDYELESRSALDQRFWRLAQEWQSICYTLRHGQQCLMSADRNERMVDAACAKGGPLKLPIHMEDLELEDRQEIQHLEMQAQQRHVNLRMDPVLDFQVLISLREFDLQIEWLKCMVSRERQRLTEAATTRVSK